MQAPQQGTNWARMTPAAFGTEHETQAALFDPRPDALGTPPMDFDAEPAGHERLTIGLLADIIGALERHGYRAADGHHARTLVACLRLTRAFEGTGDEL